MFYYYIFILLYTYTYLSDISFVNKTIQLFSQKSRLVVRSARQVRHLASEWVTNGGKAGDHSVCCQQSVDERGLHGFLRSCVRFGALIVGVLFMHEH